MENYLTYDEMNIAARIGMSTPTHFINTGSRNNCGRPGVKGSFTESGVRQGLVGARFEVEGQMEYRYCMVSKTQNTAQNGYGRGAKRNSDLEVEKEFYGVDHFFSYEEAKADYEQNPNGRFVKIGAGENATYLDLQNYRTRMKVTVEASLLDANDRAGEVGKKAYLHAVGLGLGVWAKDGQAQAKVLVELYREVLRENQLPHIGDIDFSYFPNKVQSCGEAKNDQVIKDGANEVKIHFSKRDPADPLPEPASKLLVAQYAWDGNSAPGNEYWAGMLTASGDPAAACDSTISELQNPLINEATTKNIAVFS